MCAHFNVNSWTIENNSIWRAFRIDIKSVKLEIAFNLKLRQFDWRTSFAAIIEKSAIRWITIKTLDSIKLTQCMQLSSCVPSIKLHYNTLSLQHIMVNQTLSLFSYFMMFRFNTHTKMGWCQNINWYLFLIINQVNFI